MEEPKEMIGVEPATEHRTMYVHPLPQRKGFEVRFEDNETVLCEARRSMQWFQSHPSMEFYVIQDEVEGDNEGTRYGEKQQCEKQALGQKAQKHWAERRQKLIGSVTSKPFTSTMELQLYGEPWTMQNTRWLRAEYRIKSLGRRRHCAWTYTGILSWDLELRDERGTKLAGFTHDKSWFGNKGGVLEIMVDKSDSLFEVIVLSSLVLCEIKANSDDAQTNSIPGAASGQDLAAASAPPPF